MDVWRPQSEQPGPSPLEVDQKAEPMETTGPEDDIIKVLWDQTVLKVKRSKENEAINLIDSIESRVGQGGASDALPATMTDLMSSIKDVMEQQFKDKRSRDPVSEYVEKTISILDQFIAAGDVTVSYDLVHAALPWAAVRAVLMAIASDNQLNTLMLGGLASVISLLVQCSMYQTLYLTPNPAPGIKEVRDALKDSIVTSNANSLFLLGFICSRRKSTMSIKTSSLFTEFWEKVKALGESSRELTKNAEDCENLFSLQHTTYFQELFKPIEKLRNSSTYFSILYESRQRYCILKDLRVAQGAAYDDFSHTSRDECHPATCLELLDTIYKWAADPSSPSIFWLQGTAGTGKSTIAQTVSKKLDEGTLGASFFFKRGEGDRGTARRFFETLARQLICKQPILTPVLWDIKVNEIDFGDKTLEKQFRHLWARLFEDLSLKPALEPKTVIIVVDALDECDPPEDAKLIFKLLNENISSPVKPKIFLTTRPEYDMSSQLNMTDNVSQNWILHRVEETDIQSHVRAILTNDIHEYKKQYNQKEKEVGQSRLLSFDWPGEEILERLAQLTNSSFVSAATISRMLRNDQWTATPDQKLDHIMGFNKKSENPMEDLYRSILAQIMDRIPTHARGKFINEVEKIAGSVVLLASPLSASALSTLLAFGENEIYSQLNLLSSVLDVQSPDTPVKLFHPSYRAFLLGKDCFTFSGSDSAFQDLRIKEATIHAWLAERCLQLLSMDLHNDICDLQNPGVSRINIQQEIIDKHLPPAIAYACIYWVHHVERGNSTLQDGGPEHKFLETKMLNWIEALTWLGRLSEWFEIIRTLERLAYRYECFEILKLLQDSNRFILSFKHAIEEAPLQIYNSALVFSPTNSLVRKTFASNQPIFIKQMPQVGSDWSLCVQTFELKEDGDRSDFDLIYLSSGKLMAGYQWGSVKIWDLEKASLSHKFDVRKEEYGNMKFLVTPEGRLITIGKKHIQLWDIENQQCLKTFSFPRTDSYRAELDFDLTAALSPTGDTLFLLSGRDRVEYTALNLLSGESTGIELGAMGIRNLCLSKDGKWRAYWRLSRISVCDVCDTCSYRSFDVGESFITQAIFDHNGEYLIIGLHGGEIRIMNIETGETEVSLNGPAYVIHALAICKNNEILVVASGSSIMIWDVNDQALLHTLTGHKDSIRQLAFSPDETKIASCSVGTIKIWDLQLASSKNSEAYKIGNVTYMSLGSRNQTLYHFESGVIGVWDLKSMECIKRLDLGKPYKILLGIEFSSYQPLVAFLLYDEIHIWDLTNYCQTQTLKIPQRPLMLGHPALHKFVFAKDRQLYVSATFCLSDSIRKFRYSELQIWDHVSGNCLRQSTIDGMAVMNIVASPDSSRVAIIETAEIQSSFSDTMTQIRILDGSTDHQICVIHPKFPTLSAKLSAQGTQLIVAASNGDIEIFDTATGASILGFSPYPSIPNGTERFYSALQLVKSDVIVSNDISMDQMRRSLLKKYWISRDATWLMRYSERILWIPLEYRPYIVLISESWIVLGSSGRLIKLGLD